ncbi:MAG TPA: adenine phosphoribosyltransferase [Flavobacteriaceae bacterium]|nr:adenine phosphoribosyltransferase [Flavobacteriaceae bacterium]
MHLEDYIREIPGFPKPGINFKDITPLLQHPEAMKTALDRLLKNLPETNIHKVVGIEARGFLFGTMLAEKLNAGFVPARKPGKLPFNTLKVPYALEYGMDALEIHEDAISKDENVLLHDDVLATGGTARAACELIEKLGGKIVQCNFLMELKSLYGRKKLSDYPIFSLLHF